MEQPRTPSDGPVQVLVVGADPDRLNGYDASLRESGIAARATADVDEAESLFGRFRPDAVVLDSGLPRLALFRLYGMVREDAGDPPVKLVFVGQQGDTGPDDHYLPGAPSPGTVLTQVRTLIPRRQPANGASTVAATTPAAPAPQPTTPDAPRPPRRRPARDAAAPAPPVAEAAAPSAAAALSPAVATAAASASAAPAAVPTGPSAATPVARPDGRAAATTTPTAAPAAAETADSGTTESAEGSAPAADAAPAPKPAGRRLDVVLIRVGLVLLVLGALLFLIRMQAYPPAIEAPPPAPTRRPAASPSPKPEALLPSPHHERISAYQIEISLV